MGNNIKIYCISEQNFVYQGFNFLDRFPLGINLIDNITENRSYKLIAFPECFEAFSNNLWRVVLTSNASGSYFVSRWRIVDFMVSRSSFRIKKSVCEPFSYLFFVSIEFYNVCYFYTALF